MVFIKTLREQFNINDTFINVSSIGLLQRRFLKFILLFLNVKAIHQISMGCDKTDNLIFFDFFHCPEVKVQ